MPLTCGDQQHCSQVPLCPVTRSLSPQHTAVRYPCVRPLGHCPLNTLQSGTPVSGHSVTVLSTHCSQVPLCPVTRSLSSQHTAVRYPCVRSLGHCPLKTLQSGTPVSGHSVTVTSTHCSHVLCPVTRSLSPQHTAVRYPCVRSLGHCHLNTLQSCTVSGHSVTVPSTHCSQVPLCPVIRSLSPQHTAVRYPCVRSLCHCPLNTLQSGTPVSGHSVTVPSTHCSQVPLCPVTWSLSPQHTAVRYPCVRSLGHCPLNTLQSGTPVSGHSVTVPSTHCSQVPLCPVTRSLSSQHTAVRYPCVRSLGHCPLNTLQSGTPVSGHSVTVPSTHCSQVPLCPVTRSLSPQHTAVRYPCVRSLGHCPLNTLQSGTPVSGHSVTVPSTHCSQVPLCPVTRSLSPQHTAVRYPCVRSLGHCPLNTLQSGTPVSGHSVTVTSTHCSQVPLCPVTRSLSPQHTAVRYPCVRSLGHCPLNTLQSGTPVSGHSVTVPSTHCSQVPLCPVTRSLSPQHTAVMYCVRSLGHCHLNTLQSCTVSGHSVTVPSTHCSHVLCPVTRSLSPQNTAVRYCVRTL